MYLSAVLFCSDLMVNKNIAWNIFLIFYLLLTAPFITRVHVCVTIGSQWSGTRYNNTPSALLYLLRRISEKLIHDECILRRLVCCIPNRLSTFIVYLTVFANF